MEPKERRKAKFSLYLPAMVKLWLATKAEADKRDQAFFVVHALEEAMRTKLDQQNKAWHDPYEEGGTRDVKFSLWLPRHLKDWLEQASERTGRPQSYWAVMAIEEQMPITHKD
jgi:predicted transcriptional regulator